METRKQKAKNINFICPYADVLPGITMNFVLNPFKNFNKLCTPHNT